MGGCGGAGGRESGGRAMHAPWALGLPQAAWAVVAAGAPGAQTQLDVQRYAVVARVAWRLDMKVVVRRQAVRGELARHGRQAAGRGSRQRQQLGDVAYL